MTDLEDFYVVWARTNVDYSHDLFAAYKENRGKYGVEDEVLGDKLLFLMDQFDKAPMYFEEGIDQIEGGRSVEELDDCIKHLSALPAGSVQSYIPILVQMAARLCERDFGCNYDNLVQSGTRVVNTVNGLYMKLMGQSAFLPPFPMPRYTLVDNVLDLMYQTDVLWLIDSIRMLPEIRMTCMLELEKGESIKLEDVQKLGMYTMELSPMLVLQYGNAANMVSNRPYFPPPHDWLVLCTSILESDLELYEDESLFFNEVEGSEPIVSCLKGECKIGWKIIEKLKSVLD